MYDHEYHWQVCKPLDLSDMVTLVLTACYVRSLIVHAGLST